MNGPDAWSRAKGALYVANLLWMVAATMVLLSLASPVRADPVPDAGCPGPSDDRAFATTSLVRRFAQIFTAENSGKITAVQTEVANGVFQSGDYVLAIHEASASGTPTDTVLASTTVPDAEVPNNDTPTTITGDFANPAEVVSGQRYALVVRRPVAGFPGPPGFSIGVRNGDVCSGELHSSESDAGGFRQRPVGKDMVFATFVERVRPFTVDTRDDSADESPGDEVCDANGSLQGDQCTLRAAIQETNATIVPDTINFDIPGTGARTINVGSGGLGGLPEITRPVTIDGYTQPGSPANTKAVGSDAKLLIELDGTAAGPAAGGLKISAPNVVVKGLVINRFARSGISLADANATDAAIRGNFIGTDPSGTQDLGNGGQGVLVLDASDNTIGGNGPASSNTIAFNGADGVGILNGFVRNTNRILRNSIFSNADLAIDLGPDGTTANDFGDFDTGPNDLQNFPVLTSVRTGTEATIVEGSLRSAPDEPYTLQFFKNPPEGNEGKIFVAQKSVTTNADGIGHFSLTLKGTKRIPVGKAVTATATNENGSTSEFSAPNSAVRQ